MHGLDLLDYGARHYDAALERWFVVDPLAEKYYGISPYVYVANNPVMRIGLDGMFCDDYYYDRCRNQTGFVKNDNPDRFFVQDNYGNTEYKDNNYS